jgi:hypothetical protein
MNSTPVKWLPLTYLLPAYVIAALGASWVVEQILPTTGPPPHGGYAQATGSVEATDPSNHDQVRYSYRVGARTFEAAWSADGPQGHASTLKLGQTITIWYEVRDPSKSCYCTDPLELQRTDNDPGSVVLIVLVLLTAGFLLIGGRLMFGRWLAIFESAIAAARGVRRLGSDGGTEQNL